MLAGTPGTPSSAAAPTPGRWGNKWKEAKEAAAREAARGEAGGEEEAREAREAAAAAEAEAAAAEAAEAEAAERLAHTLTQKELCASLWSMAYGNAGNQCAVAEAGGIPLLISALSSHPDIHRDAAGALRSCEPA